MNHKLLRSIQVFLLLLIIVGIGLLSLQKLWVPTLVQYILRNEISEVPPISEPTLTTKRSSFDGQNVSFTIEGMPITLVNGVSEISLTEGSATKIITRYFGNEAEGDLTGDGQPDIAFLVTQEQGGSGTLYYAVVATKEGETYATTDAFLIGDRISPQATNIPLNSSELQINYAERRPGEPMATQPSVGASLLLTVTPEGVLGVPVGSETDAESWGTVYGNVLLGPTCPVEQFPPDQACADKPYETRLALTTSDGAQVIKEFSSDATGKFSIEVPGGTYAIRSGTATIFPRCSSNEIIKVPVSGSVQVNVSCDSGIR